jgi:hypothetical protein
MGRHRDDAQSVVTISITIHKYDKPNLSANVDSSEKCIKWTPAAFASCLADWVYELLETTTAKDARSNTFPAITS